MRRTWTWTRSALPSPRLGAWALGPLVALLLGGLAGRAGADGSDRLRLQRLSRSGSADVAAYLTHVRGDGALVSGHAASDFKLTVDGVDLGPGTRALPFSETKEPIYLVAVVQLSSPAEPMLEELRRGLRALADAALALPGSHVDLIGYAGEVKRLCEGCSPAQLRAVIDRLAIDPEGAEGRLLEAVQVGIDLLRSQPAGARKLVALVSDGIDLNNERRGFTEVGRRAEQAGVVIDTVGYAPFDPGKLRSLTELTGRSGGVERVAKQPAEVAPRLAALASEIGGQQVVTFTPPIAIEGGKHEYQVLTESGAASQPLSSALVAPPQQQGDERAPMPRWPLAFLGLLPLGGVAIWLLRRRAATPVAAPPVLPAQPSLPSMRSPPQPLRTIVLPKNDEAVVGWLTGLGGSIKGRDFKLGRRVVIGSAADCDIVLQDPTVSARHCEVRQGPEGYKLVDLGSTNGLVVNDRPSREHILVDNDVFRVGRVEFKFKSI